MEQMDLPAVNLNREPAYQQIEQAIRAAITKGKLERGSRLPTIQELAAFYRTSVFTIQTALDVLAEDGLIERAPRRGTFVANSTARLRKLGIYFGCGFVLGEAMAFYQELHRQLSGLCSTRQIEYQLWMDCRPQDSHQQPLPEVLDAVAKREIQGIVATGLSARELQWVQELRVPAAIFGSGEVPFQVCADDDQGLDVVFDELKALRCRKVGTIVPMRVPHLSRCSGSAPWIEKWFERFTNRLVDNGMETHNSWIRLPDGPLSSRGHEEFGYLQFRELWSQEKRPDALFIWPDTVVRGALAAIMEMRVSVPEELKLILHRNEGIPLLSGVSASWLVTKVDRIASALLAQIERQLSGAPVSPILVPQSLESQVGSATANETHSSLERIESV